MKKAGLDSVFPVLGLVCLLVSSVTVAAEDNVIFDNQGIAVNKNDIELLLKPAPLKSQISFLKNKSIFEEKLHQIYLTKAIAADVKKNGLPPDLQAELEKQLDLLYFQGKIQQLSTRDLPDFEPLAKLEYKANKKKYMEPEKVAVEHIMIDNRKHGEAGASKLANDIKAQLDKGADFSKLAEKYSEDPKYQENHGKLGLFPLGAMIPEFDTVAFILKMGEVSKVIQTNYGFHILKKYEHKKPVQKEYAAVKGEIIEKLKNDYVKNRLDGFYEKVKQDNVMKMDDKVLDAYLSEKLKQLEAQDATQSAAAKNDVAASSAMNKSVVKQVPASK